MMKATQSFDRHAGLMTFVEIPFDTETQTFVSQSGGHFATAPGTFCAGYVSGYTHFLFGGLQRSQRSKHHDVTNQV